MDKIKVESAFTPELVAEANDSLRKYKSGKQSVDDKATANQEWWRLRHWGINDGVEGNQAEVGSAWAVNSILNKHADIMDAFPKPNVLAREADDEAEADVLSKVIPSILEQNNYEDVYSEMGYDLAVDGNAITAVVWDQSLHEGLGDVAVRNVDIHNIFWQPGVDDIQNSKYLFNVKLEQYDDVISRWPEIADKVGPYDAGTITKYMHDDNIDTSKCIEVVDCYYKRLAMRPLAEGYEIPREVVHLAILVGDNVVYCSEDVPEMAEKGFYEHGKYPFVIRRLFPIKDSPVGFGYLDIMKNPQRDIDRIDQAIIRNAILNTRIRYFAKDSANIDLDAFSDITQEIIPVSSGDLSDSLQRIETGTIPTNVISHYQNKIDELKETSGNRDFSQGSTTSGVTAASAIAALQEAGSKLSRDVNKACYRGFREECYLIVELIRQFYTEARTFRVDNGMGGYAYEVFDNARMIEADYEMPDGTIRHRRPIFDIQITSEKASPFSRAAQNETAKELYSMGLFNPEMIQPALVCIDMMDFEGKDKIKKQLQDNATMLKQYQMMAQFIAQNAPDVAVQMGLIDPTQIQQTTNGDKMSGTPEERAAKNTKEGETTLTAKARNKAASASVPK
jgi:hypothetical protein